MGLLCAMGVSVSAAAFAAELPQTSTSPASAIGSSLSPARQRVLDDLFGRLSKARDQDEAAGLAGVIERIWMRSGSDTADLLMNRAMKAFAAKKPEVSLNVFDRLVKLEPQWAEAWNKRATVRFSQNDDAGAMEDIGHVLALEPRHYGALAGVGFILQRAGQDARALEAFRRALEIYPQQEDVRKLADELATKVEGRDI